jgi:putative acetyltransferase
MTQATVGEGCKGLHNALTNAIARRLLLGIARHLRIVRVRTYQMRNRIRRSRIGTALPLPFGIPIMAEAVPAPQVDPVSVRDSEVTALLDALTSELVLGGYAATETFGYSVEQLESSQVYLVGARTAGRLVGVGGVELQDSGIGELKRFFVLPEYRSTGVADALITTLIKYAADEGIDVLRLETGDKQQSAIAFFRRHGFVAVPCFGPYLESATSLCMERRCKPADGGRTARTVENSGTGGSSQ